MPEDACFIRTRLTAMAREVYLLCLCEKYFAVQDGVDEVFCPYCGKIGDIPDFIGDEG